MNRQTTDYQIFQDIPKGLMTFTLGYYEESDEPSVQFIIKEHSSFIKNIPQKGGKIDTKLIHRSEKNVHGFVFMLKLNQDNNHKYDSWFNIHDLDPDPREALEMLLKSSHIFVTIIDENNVPRLRIATTHTFPATHKHIINEVLKKSPWSMYEFDQFKEITYLKYPTWDELWSQPEFLESDIN